MERTPGRTRAVLLLHGLRLPALDGNGTTALTFLYTVGAGQNTPNLTVTAFNLNAGTVRDAAVHHGDGKPRMAAVGLEALCDLGRELARRR